MNLNKLVNSRGEALRKELLKTETSREDKQKTFESLNSGGGSGSGGSRIKYYKLVDTLTDNDTSALGVISFSVAYIKWKITDGTYEVSPSMGVAPKNVERPVMIMVGKFSYHSEAIPGEDKINSIDYLLSIAGIKYSDLIEKEVSEEEFYEGVEL